MLASPGVKAHKGKLYCSVHLPSSDSKKPPNGQNQRVADKTENGKSSQKPRRKLTRPKTKVTVVSHKPHTPPHPHTCAHTHAHTYTHTYHKFSVLLKFHYCSGDKFTPSGVGQSDQTPHRSSRNQSTCIFPTTNFGLLSASGGRGHNA